MVYQTHTASTQTLTGLLQDYTIQTYSLGDKPFLVEHSVDARSLLCENRFDLFAKLFYIRHHTDKAMRHIARWVYLSHIVCFNPDGIEPGSTRKTTPEIFLRSFDDLIETFSLDDFNPDLSLVPVDKNGVIIDGAHRICALAAEGKSLSVVRFPTMASPWVFDRHFFTARKMDLYAVALISTEMHRWLPHVDIPSDLPLDLPSPLRVRWQTFKYTRLWRLRRCCIKMLDGIAKLFP